MVAARLSGASAATTCIAPGAGRTRGTVTTTKKQDAGDEVMADASLRGRCPLDGSPRRAHPDPDHDVRRRLAMQDTGLFLSLAEIAGVFVGFGALIAVRSGGPTEAGVVTGIRWLVSVAMWVVVTALAPVIVSRYDLAGHEIWLVCSLVALAMWVALAVVTGRSPEYRQDVATVSRARFLGEEAVGALLYVPMIAALIVVVLGLVPDQEPALYFTAVALGLFIAVFMLLGLVFSQRRPASA
jgi:hypothetical protein